MTRYAAAILGACLVAGLADAHSAGTYNPWCLLLLVIAVALAAAPIVAPRSFPARESSAGGVGAALIAVALLRPVERTWSYVTSSSLQFSRLLVLVTAVVAAALWWSGARRWVFAASVIGMVSACVPLVIASRHPNIDVWFILQGASEGLRHGSNMYTQHWTGSPGITEQFPYLPMTAVLLAPFRWLFGDVRIGLLAATAIGAYFVSRIAPRDVGGGLGALVLLIPGIAFLVEASWTEPLVLMCLTGAVLATLRGHRRWSVLSLGIAVATKQHAWLLLPMFAAWPAFGRRRTLESIGVGAALCMPWFIANPRAFWSDAFSYNLHLAPRPDSLDLFSFATRMGWTPPFWLVGVATLVAIGLAVRIARTPSGVLLGGAFALGVFNLLNKQTFFNEWWLVTSLLLAAAAAVEAEGSTLETLFERAPKAEPAAVP